MVQVKDAYLDTHDFELEVNSAGIVQLSFGPTHVCMNLKSSYELLYKLTTFLAHMEIQQTGDAKVGKKKMKKNEYLKFLTAFKKNKRMDA